MYSFVSSNLLQCYFNPLNVNFTKWPNTLKQFVGNLPTNCLSMFDHFVEFALKGLTTVETPIKSIYRNTYGEYLSQKQGVAIYLKTIRQSTDKV